MINDQSIRWHNRTRPEMAAQRPAIEARWAAYEAESSAAWDNIRNSIRENDARLARRIASRLTVYRTITPARELSSRDNQLIGGGLMSARRLPVHPKR